MTKEELYSKITTDEAAGWVKQYGDLLSEVVHNHTILLILSNVASASALTRQTEMEAAIDRTQPTVALLVGQMIADGAREGFKVGMLVGLLLDRREDTTDDYPCPNCLQTGHVCIVCNLSRYDCNCSVGEYNDTICPSCNGRGVIEK